MARARSRAIGQAETRARDPVVTRKAHERLEDPRPVGGLDPRPVVPDHHERRRAARPCLKLDEPAARRVLDRVGDQVRHDLLHAATVAGGGAEARGSARTNRRPAASAIGTSPSRTRAQASASENGSTFRAQAAGLDAAHLEQVADELRHPLRHPAASLQELALDARILTRPSRSRSR